MTHFHKLEILKRFSSNFVGSYRSPLSPSGSLFYIAENARFYRTKRIIQTENGQSISQIPKATRKEAQDALLEYLYSTRNLQLEDAKNMSKNSPHFLEKLVNEVNVQADIGSSVAPYLRYHPINEFEPFFESLGLKPHEYSPFLPRDLMFLSDDCVLLENYHVLFYYGIARNNIGKIFKGATEVFLDNNGVLAMKLKAYEELGLSRSFMIKLVVCSPYLLIGDVNADFIKVFVILRKVGVEFDRIEKHLSEKSSYDWSQLLGLLNLFRQTAYDEKQLGGLINQHPGILFEESVDRIFLLIGFLFKFGTTMNQICSLFLRFPELQFEKFVSNLRRSFLILNEMKMEVHQFGKLFRSDPLILGTCRLKKTNSLFVNLNAGKKRICAVIQDNPEVLKKWGLGSKIGCLPKSQEKLRSQMLKINFLLDIGFVENSDKMERALNLTRGRGTDLHERFDCIVRAGLNRKDVCKMIKMSPGILSQTKDALQTKIDFLMNEMGYPILSLVNFPSYLKYSIQRVKLRLAMHNWLKDQGIAYPMLSLSSLVACSDNVFIRDYVNRHPRGPKVWHDLKKEIYSK